jgi:hypothetical protein
MQYDEKEVLDVEIPAEFEAFLEDIRDIKVVFRNDKDSIEYRIVSFTALGESYHLVTNRFDLTTYEIIMLYAYRWQVELCFRFLKRTLKAIHLMCHHPRGIEIQFYIYMIAYLLLISFKQKCETINETHRVKELQWDDGNKGICDKPHCHVSPKTQRQYVRGLVTLLGEGLHKYWKISIHWITTLKNRLATPFDLAIVSIFLSRPITKHSPCPQQ